MGARAQARRARRARGRRVADGRVRMLDGAATAAGRGPRLQALAAIALAAAAALLVLSLGIGAPFEKDQETQSAQWIEAVAERGQWLLPRDDYGGIDRKPPLFYWLSAAVAELRGARAGAGAARIDEADARIVPCVAGAILAVLAMRWCAAFAGEGAGWLALAFLLGTYGFASRATLALTDILLSLLLFGAWWCIYGLLEGEDGRARAIGAGILLGLAILTKGPVAAALLGLAGMIYLLLTNRPPLAVLRRAWPWAILAIALVLGAAWYVPAFVAGGRPVVGIFLSENFGHFMPAALGGTGEASRPLWYIAARMFGGALPLSFLIVALAIALWRGEGNERARKPLLFQLSLVLAVLIFFTLASAKRDDYILPAMPSLAILFAALFSSAALAAEHENAPSLLVRDATAAVIALGCLAALAATFVILHRPLLLYRTVARMQSSDAGFMRLYVLGMHRMAVPFAAFTGAWIIGAATVFAGLRMRRELWTGAGLAALALAGSMLFTGTLRPELAQARSEKTFAGEVRRRIGGAPLYVPWGHDYELSFYFGRGVPGLLDAGAAALHASQPIYIVARPRELERLPSALVSRMAPVMMTTLVGGGGPPTLYLLRPEPANSTVRANHPAR